MDSTTELSRAASSVPTCTSRLVSWSSGRLTCSFRSSILGLSDGVRVGGWGQRIREPQICRFGDM
eukprot:9423731-Pyramimonas_sp.AAC.1